MQGPDFAVILRDQCAPSRRLVMPGNTKALQQISRGGAEMHHVETRNVILPFPGETECLAHDASTAIAAGKQRAAYLFGPPRSRLAQRDSHALAIVIEAFHRPAEAHLDQR